MERYSLLCLLLISFASMAQQSTFGILGGATLSSYIGSERFGNTSPVIRGIVGTYYGISLTNSLDIEPGLYLSQKGVNYEGSSDWFIGPGNHTLSYLSLPVVLRKKIISDLSVHAGMYVAGLVHGRYRYFYANGTTDEHESWNMLDGGRNFIDGRYTWGGQVGLRYVFPSHFVINASYQRDWHRWLHRAIHDGPSRQMLAMSVGYQW